MKRKSLVMLLVALSVGIGCPRPTPTEKTLSIDSYHPNGPWFGGFDLDYSDEFPAQDATVDFPITQSVTFKVKGGITLTGTCEPSNDYIWQKCHFTAPSGMTLCNTVVGNNDVELLAVNVVFSKTGGGGGHPQKLKIDVRNGKQKGASLACPVSVPTDPSWSNAGAISKCLVWESNGFAPPQNPSQKDLDRFAACIRAVRADYCGTGTSGTISGFIVDLSDNKTGGVASGQPNWCIEAGWDDSGATCIWVERLNAYRSFGVPLSCDNNSDLPEADQHNKKYDKCVQGKKMNTSIVLSKTEIPNTCQCNNDHPDP